VHSPYSLYCYSLMNLLCFYLPTSWFLPCHTSICMTHHCHVVCMKIGELINIRTVTFNRVTFVLLPFQIAQLGRGKLQSCPKGDDCCSSGHGEFVCSKHSDASLFTVFWVFCAESERELQSILGGRAAGAHKSQSHPIKTQEPVTARR
jgi:hypothetical protein